MTAKWTAFVSGDVLTAAQLNDVVDNFADIAIFNETQASGTNGGTFTSGSYVKRTLNTTVVNNITGCSIASSVITLPAGTYSVFVGAPAFSVDDNKCRLRNTTAATDIALGNASYSGSADSVNVISTIQTYFTLASSTNIEVQHRSANTKASNGFGVGASFGDNNIYTQITIIRVA
jgi:hypothetical protein